MRQRRLTNLDGKLDSYQNKSAIDRLAVKGHWQEFFASEQPLFMELGCGKSQFILRLSQAHPEKNFIAVEGNRSVMLRALQKAERELDDPGLRKAGVRMYDRRVEAVSEEYGAARRMFGYGKSIEYDCVYSVSPNLVFVNMYIRDLSDCFRDAELSGLYLNFSDPWPKDRHAKRRLTHAGYLEGYRKVLKPGSHLEFKTDNESLYRFSLGQFEECGLEMTAASEDLHSTDLPSAEFMTEYEEKFSLRGKKIYYAKVKFI